MNLKSLIHTQILAISAALMLPGIAAAQRSVEVIDITYGNTSGNIKAKVNLPEGRSIKSVGTHTWEMATGSCTTNNSYKTIGNYVIADIDYRNGDYFYSLDVTLDDDTVLKTDMFNSTLTEGAVWASDLEPANGGFNTKNNANHKTSVDSLYDGRPLQIAPNYYFAKGLALKPEAANGLATLKTQCRNEYGQPFTYVRFTFGLQAYNKEGDASTGNSRIIFRVNDAETGWKGNVMAYSNVNRGNKVYYWDALTTVATGINNIGLQCNTVGDDNIAVLGAIRLYYAVPQSDKQPKTVTFGNEGGVLLEDSREVMLDAYSSGDTEIHYSIIEGADIATLEGNKLTALPGKSGNIIVEAMTFGDENYRPASATVKFITRFGPAVEFLNVHTHGEDPTSKTVYLYVRPLDKTLESLRLELYDDVRSFQPVEGYDPDLTNSLNKYATYIPNLYAIPVSGSSTGTPVHRLTYKFSGEEEVQGQLCDGKEPFIYTTDLPAGMMTLRAGWGQPVVNKCYGVVGDQRLVNSKYNYSKGYGIHAAGYIETSSALDLSQFSRFAVDMGGQRITNPTRGRLDFSLYNGVATPYLTTGNVDWSSVYEWDFPLQATAAGKTVKVVFGAGGDGNTNDVVCIGAPRFYYNYTPLAPQTIEWEEETILNDYRPFSVPLEARTSTGEPAIYRLTRGSDYAEIRNGNTLYVKTIPQGNETIIEVEAFQPGTVDFEPSATVKHTFRLRRSVVIPADQRVSLQGGHDIDELVVFANARTSGQAMVESGIVNVKRLVLKYTFAPGEWTHINFPSDLDLADISDLEEKGFRFSSDADKNNAYSLRYYDSRRRSDSPSDDAWMNLDNTKVLANKGYIMKLERDDKTPVEITFTIDNVALTFDNTIRSLNVAIDMSECEPETRHIVYIRPTNVDGNTLRVDMRFVPSNTSNLPLNHARALEAMRITRTPVRGAIRLTLPEQTPAKVAIFDRKGKKLLKAVNYISPMKIDISDLKPGKYKMVVVYGPASIEREVEL